MRHYALITTLVCAPAMGFAQDGSDDDQGYLAGLIQDNLSGAGRDVQITGFEGALSSQATIEQLTIADDDGVWLTLDDVVLDWNRAALLLGRVDINTLSASAITLARAPVAPVTDNTPAPEATPFALPELPVSISLDTLAIERITLGASFLGEEVAFSLTGDAQLGGGEGSANIAATRLGDKTGVFEINGSFVNETRVLGLNLTVDEGPAGIAVTLLDLPGAPALRLAVDGTAPLDDYTATIALATDGEDRLAGSVTLNTSDAGRRVLVDLGGDVTPLFAQEYQAFFGDDTSLRADALLGAEGRVDVSELDLQAQRLTLSGALAIAPGGWPERIDLTGGIVAQGAPVLLPLSGPQTFIDGADLAVSYDAAQSDDWRADIAVAGLTRPGLAIDAITLEGGGTLRADALVTATLDYAARGLALDDAGASEAFGDAITGQLIARRLRDGPFEISRLTLTGAGLDAQIDGTIDGADAGLRTQANMAFAIAGLDRFSALAGRDLGGAADLDVVLDATPLEGLFDVRLDGRTVNLSVGIAQADAVLAGTGSVAARLVRDADGTRAEDVRVQTPQAVITGAADLTSDGSDARFDARLNDLAVVVPELAGPATAAGRVVLSGEGVADFNLRATGPAATLVTVGTMTPAETGPLVDMRTVADIRDLTAYAAIAGRPLSGAVRLTLDGDINTDGLLFDMDVQAQTNDLTTGIAQADALLAGRGDLAAQVSRMAADAIRIGGMQVTTPALALRGNASLAQTDRVTADLDLRINDMAVIDAGLSGPLTLAVTADPVADGTTDVSVQGAGPGIDLDLDGAVAAAADDYEISGDLTAALADLSAYRSLVGQPIGGAVELSASGAVMPDLSAFDARVRLQSENLAVGNPSADALLRGTGRINADLGLADGTLALRTVEISTPELSVVAALNGAQGAGQGRFNASLRNIGVLTDQIAGPVRATGSASLDADGNWGIDANGTGPGGLAARIAGTFNPSGRLNVDINGRAPLALANNAIDPRRLSGTANFDLAVNGPPALSSLSGRVTFDEGRLAAPNLAQALENIGGAITIANNRAQIDLRADVEAGGSLNITGPVGLVGPNTADIAVQLNNIVLRDPALYSTRVSGRITLAGALQGGARIAGQLNLGQTDVQVPSSSISSLGELPNVVHQGADAAVRRTLARAGLSVTGAPQAGPSGGGGAAFPLNIVINAPGRIFIRGRGLDAELGGRLTIGGTTANVIPVGRFDLVRGRISILQQRFDLSEGSASMQGEFVPYIRLVATTQSSSGTTISIVVDGPAAEPEVSFVSVPELPQDEVLAQLIFGRDLENISPFQAVQLASAISTLAGRGGGTMDRLRNSVGLDDFDVTTADDGSTAVRAGKYLSENVYTDVTVTSEGGTEINLNLDITDEITAKGSVDQDGETGIGLFFQRDY